MYRQRLLDFGVAASLVDGVEAAAQQAVDEATEIAKASSPPSIEGVENNLWADGGSSWRN